MIRLMFHHRWMRYTQTVKEEIRQLRLEGLTLDQITKKTGYPRTTVHLWIKDIRLTDEQISIIKDNALNSLQKGRVKVQAINKVKYKKLEIQQLRTGLEAVGKLTKRELLIAGTALYWAEGFKSRHERRLGFCNSDPDMIVLYLRWLKECMDVSRKDVTLRLTINTTYKYKVNEIERYWSEVTGVPRSQFTKVFLQKGEWKKVYSTNVYYGVLRVHVNKSWGKLMLTKGLINGLRMNAES